MNTTKHEFALYVSELSELLKADCHRSELYINDELLCHRIAKVLRLGVGDCVTLFDRLWNAHCRISGTQGKRQIVLQLLSKHKNMVLVPSITCVLPLLKRDDFESSVYLLAELGVTIIQPVFTEKSVRVWAKERERERLERIVIAAAEQSKYFSMPIISEPVSLAAWCIAASKKKSIKIYFDGQGRPLLDLMSHSSAQVPSAYDLMVGPEGDLTPDEKNMVQQAGFLFCRLTPTVLRAVHALCLGVGAFRSL